MSIPRLGIINEVNGEFHLNFNLEQDQDYLIFKQEDNSLRINEFYKSLIDQNKIKIEWKLICDSTFLNEYSKKGELKIEKVKLSKKFQIIYYLKSLENFILEKNEFFTPFYNQDYNIKKGEILSDQIKETFYANNDLNLNQSNFIKFEFQEEFQSYLEVDYEYQAIRVLTNDINLKNQFIKFDRASSYKEINRQILLSSIIIQAIQWIGNNPSKDYAWTDFMKNTLSVDDENVENLKDFVVAMDYYYNVFEGEKSLNRVYQKLSNLE